MSIARTQRGYGGATATDPFLGAGAEGQTRTADTYIFSVVLYQLSYLGTRRILSTAAGSGQAPAVRPDASDDCRREKKQPVARLRCQASKPTIEEDSPWTAATRAPECDSGCL